LRRKKQGTATKMFKILLGLSNILNITKENSGRNSGGNSGRTEAVVAAEGAGGSGLWPRQQWQESRQQPTAATAGAGNGGESRGRVRAENQEAVAIAAAAETVLVEVEMAAAVAVAAAMVMAAMAATTRQPWQR